MPLLVGTETGRYDSHRANNVILRVNHAFTEVTGYTHEETVGKKVNILNSGRHDATFFAAMWESLNKTDAWKGEIQNRRKNGEIYTEFLNISTVRDQNGIVINYVATFTDLSERKQAESDLAEQLNELRRWHDVTSGREGRIIDLKHEVNELLDKVGQPPRYPSAETDGQQEK